MIVIGRFIEHSVNEATGQCSCAFTHPRTTEGEWDVTRDTRWGPLIEIPPLYDEGQPDIYVYWPF